jgi:hypothetical protein
MLIDEIVNGPAWMCQWRCPWTSEVHRTRQQDLPRGLSLWMTCHTA